MATHIFFFPIAWAFCRSKELSTCGLYKKHTRKSSRVAWKVGVAQLKTIQWPASFPMMGAGNWKPNEAEGVINECSTERNNVHPEPSHLHVFNSRLKFFFFKKGVYSFIFPNIEKPYYIQVLLTSLAKNVTGLIVTNAIKPQGWKQNLCSQCSHIHSLWTPWTSAHFQ